MINNKVILSVDSMEDNKFCETANDLFFSRDLYILLERFCNQVSREDAEFEWFLNQYFNDEGYVDVWRIPYLMLDLYKNDLNHHKDILQDLDFKRCFLRFVGLFYNYCLFQYKLCLIEEQHLADVRRNVLEIKRNQHLLNLIMDTYSRIIENLNSN